MADNKEYLRVQIKDSDVDSSGTDTGYFLDVIAQAVDSWTQNEMEENNLEWIDESVKYVIDNFDYEAAFIEWLSNGGQFVELIKKPGKKTLAKIMEDAAEKSELQKGAWFALEHELDFYSMLETFTEEEKERALDRGFSLPETRSALGKECEEAADSASRDLYNMFLNGDRNDDGILQKLSREVTGERGNVDYYEPQPHLDGHVMIDCDPDQAREFIESQTGAEIEGEPTEAELSEQYKAAVIDWMQYASGRNTAKQKAENEKRRAEAARVREYQAKQREAAKAAKIEKLKSMKKGN